LLRHLASHGFVVAAPSHMDCVTQACRADPAHFVAAAQRRPTDAISVLDTVLTLNDTDDADLGGLIDSDRVGVAGWSFGGYTALRAMELDDRFRAALVFAPEVRDFPDNLIQVPDPRQVRKPAMFMIPVARLIPMEEFWKPGC